METGFTNENVAVARELLATFGPASEVAVETRDEVPVVRFQSAYADGYFLTWEHVARFLVSFCSPARD